MHALYSDGLFDQALDKGTLDGILCSDGKEEDAAAMLAEVARVLKPKAVLMLVSFGNPAMRADLLLDPALPWSSVVVHLIGRKLKARGRYQASGGRTGSALRDVGAGGGMPGSGAASGVGICEAASGVGGSGIGDGGGGGGGCKGPGEGGGSAGGVGWSSGGLHGGGKRAVFDFFYSDAIPISMSDFEDDEGFGSGPKFPVNACTHYCYVCTKQ
eukprot:gene30209-35193_t